ncbi:MAG: ATP-binding cassette domain-containing protein [Alphaproteobacteria bacterium]
MAAGTPAIAVRDLTVRIGGRVVLEQVGFTAPKGAITVLAGDNESGATTAIKAVAGIERAAGGTVEIDGKDVTKLRAGRRNVALVFETHALFPHMTVFENVAYPLRVAKLGHEAIARRVGEVAELLGFTHVLNERPREVPEGLKRRAGLARAVVREPVAYLFDRPLSSLDDDYRGAARGVIAFLRERFNATILMPSGDGEEAARLADRLVVMSAGSVLQEGAAATVRAAPVSLEVAQRVIVPPLVLRDAGIAGIEPAGLRIRTSEGRVLLLPVEPGDAEIGERVSLGVVPSRLRQAGWDALPPDVFLLFDSTGRGFPRRDGPASG